MDFAQRMVQRKHIYITSRMKVGCLVVFNSIAFGDAEVFMLE